MQDAARLHSRQNSRIIAEGSLTRARGHQGSVVAQSVGRLGCARGRLARRGKRADWRPAAAMGHCRSQQTGELCEGTARRRARASRTREAGRGRAGTGQGPPQVSPLPGSGAQSCRTPGAAPRWKHGVSPRGMSGGVVPRGRGAARGSERGAGERRGGTGQGPAFQW